MDLCLKEFKGDPITISIKLQKRLLHLSKDLGTCQGGRTPSLLLLLLLLLFLAGPSFTMLAHCET